MHVYYHQRYLRARAITSTTITASTIRIAVNPFQLLHARNIKLSTTIRATNAPRRIALRIVGRVGEKSRLIMYAMGAMVLVRATATIKKRAIKARNV
jgi:hypothetical protein